MGYELHIIRKNDLEDFDEESNIGLDEWLAYIDTDPDLVITTTYMIKDRANPGKVMPAPGYCDWLAHPTNRDPNGLPWLAYFGGAIISKYPDEALVHKMVAIAKVLGGCVQGDEGEFYDKTYQEQLPVPLQPAKRPWWKFW